MKSYLYKFGYAGCTEENHKTRKEFCSTIANKCLLLINKRYYFSLKALLQDFNYNPKYKFCHDLINTTDYLASRKGGVEKRDYWSYPKIRHPLIKKGFLLKSISLL